eukprot:153132-Alexandrium_andersonii.AAC.1
MAGLITWLGNSQGLLVLDPDTGCVRIPADRVTVIIIDDGHSLTGGSSQYACTEPAAKRVAGLAEALPKVCSGSVEYIPDETAPLGGGRRSSAAG